MHGVARISRRGGGTFTGPTVNPSQNGKVTVFDQLFLEGPILQTNKTIKNQKIGPRGTQIFTGPKETSSKTGKLTGFGPLFF